MQSYPFVRILLDFPLTESIPQVFDIIITAIEATQGQSHIFTGVYFDVFEVRYVALSHHLVFVNIAQKDAAGFLVPGCTVDEAIIIFIY